MDVRYERCCGIDVHKQKLVACCILPAEGASTKREFRTFGAMTEDILALSDWLAKHQVTHVAMESTGSYWKPLWNLLEGSFELVLVNPVHLKAFNRDKTDKQDCAWLADLLRHGLLKGSFVPDRRQRELREVVRYRNSLVEERAAEVNRLQKVLEGANIKLAAVASDVMGVSARKILAALLAGHLTPAEMANLARGKLREKIPELERSLVGELGQHQRVMIAELLAHIDYLDEAIQRLSEEVSGRLDPFEKALVERLDAIPGIAAGVAEVIVSEVGSDVSRFESANHLTSWAGVCPGNRESAGKRKSGKTHKGNQSLRRASVQAAHGASKKNGAYLQAQFRRLLPRLGAKKAYLAIARQILIIVYHLIKTPDSMFVEKGAHYLKQEQADSAREHHLRKLQALGYIVNLQPQSA
jgi:transposase